MLTPQSCCIKSSSSSSSSSSSKNNNSQPSNYDAIDLLDDQLGIRPSTSVELNAGGDQESLADRSGRYTIDSDEEGDDSDDDDLST